MLQRRANELDNFLNHNHNNRMVSPRNMPANNYFSNPYQEQNKY
jgi:hypothetical protein